MCVCVFCVVHETGPSCRGRTVRRAPRPVRTIVSRGCAVGLAVERLEIRAESVDLSMPRKLTMLRCICPKRSITIIGKLSFFFFLSRINADSKHYKRFR